LVVASAVRAGHAAGVQAGRALSGELPGDRVA
jgi:hypothetical protein